MAVYHVSLSLTPINDNCFLSCCKGVIITICYTVHYLSTQNVSLLKKYVNKKIKYLDLSRNIVHPTCKALCYKGDYILLIGELKLIREPVKEIYGGSKKN